MRSVFLASIILSLTATFGLTAAERDAELEYAEKFLQDEKIKTDGDSLIAFFNEHALQKVPDPVKIKQLVTQLGDDDFELREQAEAKLCGLGRAAKQELDEAVKDNTPGPNRKKYVDFEVLFRAERCLSRLEEGREMLRISYAAKVLAERKPKGAAQALLNYLPSAMDQTAEEAVFAALGKVGIADGKPLPAIIDALADKEPLRRAAAALVLAAVKDQRSSVIKLLDDSDPRVRYYAASVLVPLGEKKAVDTLMPILTDGNMTTARMAEDLLFRLASAQKVPDITLSDSSDTARKKARTAWEKWWKDNQEKVDLAKLNLEDALLGYTVIAEYSDSGKGAGRVWECGPDGKQRWEITDVASPMDVQVLPGSRVLIAESGRITERDHTGKVLWEVKTTGACTSCQRLTNGNTVAFTYTDIVEYDRDGKQVFSHNHGGNCYGGNKLRNGNYVYMVSGGQLTEITPEGKTVRSIRPDSPDVSGCGYWVSVEGLPNGNYLVSMGSSGRVAEIDMTGKVLWSCKTDQTTGATRLRNGNTLAVNTEARAVVEYDREGKEVWRAKTVGRPFRVRRY